MQEFEPHPKEKEMKANHETLGRIQWWASLLDGVCDADVDSQAVDGKGWHKMSVWSFLSRIGLAFILGLIPGVGFLICATLSYFKVYRPLMDRFMFDDSDRVTLQRYARQCFVTDLLIGLLFPVAPFLRLVFCGNLRMVDSAWIRVVRHDEKCAKAFSESCLGSAAAVAEVNAALTATGSSGLLKQDLTHRMTTKTIKKKPQEALQRLVIPAPPHPAKPIIPRAVTVMNFTTYPSLSPIPELPEAAEAEVAKVVTPIPIPGQQQQRQQPAAATGWHYPVGSDDEAMDGYFVVTVIDAPGADEVHSVPLPRLGAQARHSRATEAVYRPYEITSSTAENCFTPPEAHDVEGDAEGEDEDVDDGSLPASPKERALTTCTLPLPWPIPKCKQHHIPPQYYYLKQGHLSDDYWRLSCPLLTGLGAISGSGATTRSGSRQGGSDSSSPNSSADSSLGNPVDLKAMALARGCVSMSSALPVMRWRNRDVEYEGSLVGGGGVLTDENDFGTDEDEDIEEEEEKELENSDSDADEKMYECGDYEGDDREEEGLQTQGSDLSSAGDCEFGRGGSSESGGSGG
ncbi:hypothetical protein BGX30_001704 [Mortierella sp. GBA39]|nr:hypothetical protein BGX30_001704 [Mortierella sp. GBA39]